MTESKIVGTMDEENVNGEGPVRVVLYLYDVVGRELRRIALPEVLRREQKQALEPVISILAVSPDALHISIGGATEAKEHVVHLEQ
jgi:hypothetical protein